MTQKTTKANTEKRGPGCGTSLFRMILAIIFFRFFAAQSTAIKLILLVILILGPGRSSLKEFRTLTTRWAPLLAKGTKGILTTLRKNAATAFSNLSRITWIAAIFYERMIRFPTWNLSVHRKIPFLTVKGLSQKPCVNGLSPMKMLAIWRKAGGSTQMKTVIPAKHG